MIFCRTLATLPLLALALTGCGGRDAAPVANLQATKPGAPSTVTSAGPTPQRADAPDVNGGLGGGQSPSANPPVVATAPVAGSSSVPVSQPGTAGQQHAAGQPAAAAAFTQPGSYPFDTTGSATALGSTRDASGASTLTVDPPAGQAQHSVLGDSHGKTSQDVVVHADGTYLTRLEISNTGFDRTFAPSPAALLLPSPATPGTTWSWTAVSSDGKTTLTSKNTVLGTETLAIGGEQVDTSVIRTELTLRGGDLTYDGTQDTWFAPAQRLPVKLHTTGNGTASGVVFSIDTTSTARSTHPS